MKDNNHIATEVFHQLKQNNLNPLDQAKHLEHILVCDYCLNKYMDFISEDMIEAPSYMKEDIVSMTKQPYNKALKAYNKTAKQVQLFFYSLKVGCATAGALIALLLLTKLGNPASLSDKALEQNMLTTSRTSVSVQLKENADSLNNFLINFSNSVIKMEDYQYDQKEK